MNLIYNSNAIIEVYLKMLKKILTNTNYSYINFTLYLLAIFISCSLLTLWMFLFL